LTSAIKSYRGESVATGIILDNDATTVAFPAAPAEQFHRGRNLHHIIYANPAASNTITIAYSLDGENFFDVFVTAAGGDNLYWDTGRNSIAAKPLTTGSPTAAGGGAMTCPPALVKLTCTGGFTELQVLTYGTMIR
tara:strand:+ start:845 stop:1252 length:408 start_codon:yes stop_codon:yes gene_type:complete